MAPTEVTETSVDERTPLAPQKKPILLYQNIVLVWVMLPIRIGLFLVLFLLLYPLLLVMAFVRALYLRIAVGLPSTILEKGTHGNTHMVGVHYPCIHTFTQPLDEVKLRKVLLNLCAEDGIMEDEVDLQVFPIESGVDWPTTGSHDVNHFFPSWPRGKHFFQYWDGEHPTKTGKGKKVRYHVFNGQPGKPTVVLFAGSGNGWDGSSNFNFNKEVQSRYVGNPPNDVYQKPSINPASKAKFDAGSFAWFLCKMPYNLTRSLGGLLWNAIRAAHWAGGNGLDMQTTAMSFSVEDSRRLAQGAKKLGVKPFACFTYASVKACREVLDQSPDVIVQQASLQTRHFPVAGQHTGSRDYVGDWLFGPLQYVPTVYTLTDAQRGHNDLMAEIDDWPSDTRGHHG